MRPERRPESLKALGLLITFVVGGFFMPVIHKADHSAEWSRKQAAAHAHGDNDTRTVLTVCADVDTELPDCRLCHRNWLDRFDPDRLPQLIDPSETLPSLTFEHVPFFLVRINAIRGPPALV